MADDNQKIPLTEEQQKDLIKSLFKSVLENQSTPTDNRAKANLLRELKGLYDKKIVFAVGDIIKWKPQLKNRKLPDYEEPMIVLNILENPIISDTSDTGSTYFNEKFNIKAGVYRDDTMLTFYFDGGRFEKIED